MTRYFLLCLLKKTSICLHVCRRYHGVIATLSLTSVFFCKISIGKTFFKMASFHFLVRTFDSQVEKDTFLALLYKYFEMFALRYQNAFFGPLRDSFTAEHSSLGLTVCINPHILYILLIIRELTSLMKIKSETVGSSFLSREHQQASVC